MVQTQEGKGRGKTEFRKAFDNVSYETNDKIIEPSNTDGENHMTTLRLDITRVECASALSLTTVIFSEEILTLNFHN